MRQKHLSGLVLLLLASACAVDDSYVFIRWSSARSDDAAGEVTAIRDWYLNEEGGRTGYYSDGAKFAGTVDLEETADGLLRRSTWADGSPARMRGGRADGGAVVAWVDEPEAGSTEPRDLGLAFGFRFPDEDLEEVTGRFHCVLLQHDAESGPFRLRSLLVEFDDGGQSGLVTLPDGSTSDLSVRFIPEDSSFGLEIDLPERPLRVNGGVDASGRYLSMADLDDEGDGVAVLYGLEAAGDATAALLEGEFWLVALHDSPDAPPWTLQGQVGFDAAGGFRLDGATTSGDAPADHFEGRYELDEDGALRLFYGPGGTERADGVLGVGGHAALLADDGQTGALTSLVLLLRR